MPDKKPNQTAPERYEDIVAAIESLVEGIESGKIGLEDSIEAYEQGVKLIARARAILTKAEQRVESLDLEALRKKAEEEV